MAFEYYVYPKKYVTTQGETWDTISLDFYGTPYRVKELIECNRMYSDVLIFDGNVELNIPILDEASASTLAPWKRGV